MNKTKPASGNMYITIISSQASNTLDHLVLKIGNFNENSTNVLHLIPDRERKTVLVCVYV